MPELVSNNWQLELSVNVSHIANDYLVGIELYLKNNPIRNQKLVSTNHVFN